MSTGLDVPDQQAERRAMVDRQVRGRGVVDERVLEAMVVVPRHLFVPEQYRQHAHADRPWPIGHGQTISQPLMVALMIDAARFVGEGWGSGLRSGRLPDALAARAFEPEASPPGLPAGAGAPHEALQARLRSLAAYLGGRVRLWQAHMGGCESGDLVAQLPWVLALLRCGEGPPLFPLGGTPGFVRVAAITNRFEGPQLRDVGVEGGSLGALPAPHARVEGDWGNSVVREDRASVGELPQV